MSPYLRKVKTASGATAVQIVEKTAGVRRIVEHLGSAHDEAELAALMTAGREKLTAPDQAMLDFGGPTVMQPAVVTGSRSAVLVEAIQTAWSALGFGVFYGAYHQLSLTAADKAKASQRDWEHKESLIREAKQAWARDHPQEQPKKSGGTSQCASDIFRCPAG